MSNNYLAEPKSAPNVNASCNALLQFFLTHPVSVHSFVAECCLCWHHAKYAYGCICK